MSKTQSFDDLLAKRIQFLREREEQLADLESEIRAAALAKGFTWNPVSTNGPGKPIKNNAMAETKRQQHAEIRAEAVRRGWFHTEGRRKGQPDTERVRLHRKAAKEGLTVEALRAKEAAENLKRMAARVKDVKNGKVR